MRYGRFLNCRKAERCPAETDHLGRRLSGDASHDCGRDAVALNSVVCDRAQRRTRGSTRYVCAGRKESTAQCAAAQVALPGLAAVAGHERDDALAIGLRGGYMVAHDCGDTARKCLQKPDR
jgi:hypothetical protein